MQFLHDRQYIAADLLCFSSLGGNSGTALQMSCAQTAAEDTPAAVLQLPGAEEVAAAVAAGVVHHTAGLQGGKLAEASCLGACQAARLRTCALMPCPAVPAAAAAVVVAVVAAAACTGLAAACDFVLAGIAVVADAGTGPAFG